MCEVRGVGFDLCAISRMEKLLENQAFLNRCFTQEEQAYVHARGLMASASMAAMWAAKEAAGKAFGCGIAFPMTDVEVLHSESGRPYYHLRGEALKRCGGGKLHLSLSHEGDLAGAVCVWTSGA